MKYRDIMLPEELLPDEEFIENAKEIEASYAEAYNALMNGGCEGITASQAIYVIAKVNAERLALMIGVSLTDYDKDVLMGVIERQIVKKVFIE